MYRLILNPNKEQQDFILSQLKEYPQEYVGMHIRSGGALANRKEKGYWIEERDLLSLTAFINSTMNIKHLSPSIFLSTDSDLIDFFLRVSLPNFHFLSRMSFMRYHTTANSSSDALTGALFDAFVCANSKHFFYTRSSGYSILIKTLGSMNSHFILPTTFSIGA